MALISISGKKSSGKDTAGKILNILLNSPQLNNEGVLTYLRKDVISNKDWQIKKFADKLKDIVCLLIGCNREQLENEEFKSTPLLEEWWYWKLEREGGYSTILLPYSQSTGTENFELVKMTPRLMLTLLGTECGRKIIHPQIWVNALMSEYKLQPHNGPTRDLKYPNWIITDMRFLNEQQAVDIRDGICIRVNRIKKLSIDDFKPGMKYQIKERFSDGTVKSQEDYDNAEWLDRFYHESERPYIERMINGRNAQNGLLGLRIDEHESETALDNALFDYTIDNNGTIDELIDKVRVILTRENLLCKVVKDN